MQLYLINNFIFNNICVTTGLFSDFDCNMCGYNQGGTAFRVSKKKVVKYVFAIEIGCPSFPLCRHLNCSQNQQYACIYNDHVRFILIAHGHIEN